MESVKQLIWYMFLTTIIAAVVYDNEIGVIVDRLIPPLSCEDPQQ